MSKTKKIEALTEEQVARLPMYRDEALAHGLSTERCDRAAVEKYADECYTNVNLQPPKLKLWFESPYAGAVASAILAEASDTVKDLDAFAAEVYEKVELHMLKQPWYTPAVPASEEKLKQAAAATAYTISAETQKACFGSHDAGWLSFYNFFDKEGLVDVKEVRPLVKMLACGWWWPYEQVVVLTERPLTISRDDSNNLHSVTGPALSYADGFSLWMAHGVRIPSDIITSPENLTCERIDKEENAEVRRAMVTQYGVGKYLVDSKAVVVSHDEAGILYRKEQKEDEPIVMVRVLNPTPDPEGTLSKAEAIAIFGPAAHRIMDMEPDSNGAELVFKEYFISVHPECRPLYLPEDGMEELYGKPQELTATNAVASTFGLYGDDYCPSQES